MTPFNALSVAICAPNSAHVVLAIVISPASRKRVIRLVSIVETLPLSSRQPASYGVPFISSARSLSTNGTPNIAPRETAFRAVSRAMSVRS